MLCCCVDYDITTPGKTEDTRVSSNIKKTRKQPVTNCKEEIIHFFFSEKISEGSFALLFLPYKTI